VPAEKRTVDVSQDMAARDSLIQEGLEAQWCIFDSTLSTIYGQAFWETGAINDLEKQTWYLNRALGQLTGKDSIYGEFRCPELYYIEKGKYVPNDATPLLWAQANLMVAMHQMRCSLERTNILLDDDFRKKPRQ
jgi:phosphorylase kinase alpha/beta subunit